VEVTCTESGALNKGSSKVTCITDTEFSCSSNEPNCSKPKPGKSPNGLKFLSRDLGKSEQNKVNSRKF
jgi:hypothetical protein